MTNITINGLNLVFSAFYISAFAYYQPKRKYLIGQLAAWAITVKAIYTYVDWQTPEDAPDVMGTIAAGGQIASLAGGIYEIKRAISMGTTEYIPASFQFAIFTLILQWFAFGILHGNKFIAVANLAGLFVNVATIALYPIYPPLTWTVPIFNIPPQEKEKKSE
ncbi:hypothetical protein WR25_17334 isoform B [Diploscapter pachys]|nr:hypothetical protein WR25_17334 isoform B [Diploscapter pachys]